MQQRDLVRTCERSSVYDQRLEKDRPIKKIKELLRHGLSEGLTNARVASTSGCLAVYTLGMRLNFGLVVELSADR